MGKNKKKANKPAEQLHYMDIERPTKKATKKDPLILKMADDAVLLLTVGEEERDLVCYCKLMMAMMPETEFVQWIAWNAEEIHRVYRKRTVRESYEAFLPNVL